jgi:tetratricopeptide (TPR) repeat protein
MGRVALELEEWEGSIVHLKRALARYPTSPRIRLDLAQAHYQMSQYEETIEVLQEAARYAIFDPEAMAAARKALEVPDSQTDQEPMQTY